MTRAQRPAHSQIWPAMEMVSSTPWRQLRPQNKFNKGETEAQSISILPKATQQSHAKLGRGPWGLAHQSRP